MRQRLDDRRVKLMTNIVSAIHDAQEQAGGLNDMEVAKILLQIMGGALKNLEHQIDDLKADLDNERWREHERLFREKYIQ